MKQRREFRLPESGRSSGSRRPSRPLVLSAVLHLVVAALFAKFLISPEIFASLFSRVSAREVPAERISFLRLPRAEGPEVQGRSGGDGRPESTAPRVRIVAPETVPVGIPDPAPAPAPPVEEGSGPLVGTGGPARGIRPTFSDPRVWEAPGDLIAAPKSAKEKMDSAIASFVQPYNDSVAVASGQRKPGDWTFERNGRKYGIDPQYIRLGKVSIPTALIALLPINQQANPTALERNRLQNQLHSDIFRNAQRGMNEADFRKAVRSIRERKERERAEEEKKARQTEEPAARSPAER